MYGATAGTGVFSFHSANVVLTALYLYGLLTGNLYFLISLGSVKLLLYLLRKMRGAGKVQEAGRVLSMLRVVLGFGFPLYFLWQEPGTLTLPMIAAVAAGELIDRCEFYLGLRFTTPAGQIEADLKKEIYDSAAFFRSSRS